MQPKECACKIGSCMRSTPPILSTHLACRLTLLRHAPREHARLTLLRQRAQRLGHVWVVAKRAPHLALQHACCNGEQMWGKARKLEEWGSEGRMDMLFALQDSAHTTSKLTKACTFSRPATTPTPILVATPTHALPALTLALAVVHMHQDLEGKALHPRQLARQALPHLERRRHLQRCGVGLGVEVLAGAQACILDCSHATPMQVCVLESSTHAFAPHHPLILLYLPAHSPS